MLLRSLRRYELHHDEQGEQEMCPSASLVNQFELEFLRELCDLTRIAMRREMGEVDFFEKDESHDEDDGFAEGEEAGSSPGLPLRERRWEGRWFE